MFEEQKSTNFYLIAGLCRNYQGKLYGKCVYSYITVAKQYRYTDLTRRWCAMWNQASNTSKSERALQTIRSWFKTSKQMHLGNEAKVRIFVPKGLNKD